MRDYGRRRKILGHLIEDLSKLERYKPYDLDHAAKIHGWDLGSDCHRDRNIATNILMAMSRSVQTFKLDVIELSEKIKIINDKGDQAVQLDLYNRQLYMGKLFSEKYLGSEYENTWFSMDREQMWNVILTVNEMDKIFYKIRYENTGLWITPANDGNLEWQDNRIRKRERSLNKCIEENAESYIIIPSNKSEAELEADISRIDSSTENHLVVIQLNGVKKATLKETLENIRKERQIACGDNDKDGGDNNGGDNNGGDNNGGDNNGGDKNVENNALIRLVPKEKIKGFVDISDILRKRSIV